MAVHIRKNSVPLFSIISSLADNKQAIGRHYASWCNGAPALEASVAAAAMAQDELGHARTLYPLLEDFVQAQNQPQQIVPATRTLRYHLAVLDDPPCGWFDFVALNFLIDTAFTTFFEAAQDSTYEPLRQRARKILQEEHIHFIHAEGWVRRLAKTGGAVRANLEVALRKVWTETLCWFGPADDHCMLQLHHEGIINASPDTLRNRYFDKIMPTLSALQIAVPVTFNGEAKNWELTCELPWPLWDAEARRLRGS
ncbi:MAG TPA: Phenylacetic acid catabolic protein [Ktedonobacteraceae bacterium]|jgi:phenylacetate-CoA oxygenase PaaI subunit|nr:Phenylacetic acid catabolic protein [Ktedonobacteraceae bacterium]